MSGHNHTIDTLKRTLAYLDAAQGNATHGARLAGLPRQTFVARLSEARRRLDPNAVLPAQVSHPDVVRHAAEAAELISYRKEVGILRQALATRGKVAPLKVPARRAKAPKSLTRVIIPDSHGSHIDPDAQRAFLQDLKALDPDEIVGLGDHVDCGGFLAAHHTLGYVAQLDEVGYEADLNAWGTFLDAIQKAAPRAHIHILEGNHELRIQRWAVDQALGNGKNADFLNRAVGPEYRLDYKGRGIRYAHYGEFHDGLPARGIIRIGKCFFTHGFSLGTRAAENHARKVGGPVVYGHTHTAAGFYGSTVKEGAIAAWNFGTLSKRAPRYMHNNPDNWSLGYGTQFVAPSGLFTTFGIPIIDGTSLLPDIMRKG